MSRTLSALNLIPLLVFPLLVYNLVVLTGMAPQGGVGAWLADPIASLGMFSGETWGVSFADLFVGASLLLLFVEIVKSTRTDTMSIANHGLSVLLVAICIVQFTALRGFSTSAFFLLTLMTILDVVAGFTVTIVAAKRDFGTPTGHHH